MWDRWRGGLTCPRCYNGDVDTGAANSSEDVVLTDLTMDPAMSRPAVSPGRPSWKVLVGLVGVLAVAMVSFSFGRAAPAAESERLAPELITPEAIAPEAATPLVETSQAAGPLGDLPVAVKGAEILAEVAFADSSAFVLCRQAESGEGPIRISVAHIAESSRVDGLSELLTMNEIGSLTSCGACALERVELAGEPMILGTCGDSSVLSGMPPERARNSKWAFVVAEPGNELESALAMRVHCGETSIEVDGDELVVAGQLTPGGTVLRALQLPPVRFSREGSFFQADDPGILDHFCSVTNDDQLQRSPWRNSFGYSELTHLRKESSLGSLGFHGPVLVAITNQQCAQLFRARLAAHEQPAAPEVPALASLVGWPAPDGFEDWFLTCRPER